MPCEGGVPKVVDMENTKDKSVKFKELREWLVNIAKIDDVFLPDLPVRDSYNQWEFVFFTKENEENKLCQVIEHIGDNRFYEIMDAAGIRCKQARVLIEFWQERQKIDKEREIKVKREAIRLERNEVESEISYLISKMSVDELKELIKNITTCK